VSTAITTGGSAAVPELPPLSAADWGRAQRTALLIAATGGAAFAVFGLLLWSIGQLLTPAPRQFLLSYLTAWTFCLGMPLGCLVALMVQHLTGGAWGLILRRTFEAGVRTLPLLAVLGLPILLGVPWLYEWMQPQDPNEHAFWEHKHLWLNYPGFAIRFVLYFAVLVTLGLVLDRWSDRQDREGPAFDERRFRLLSGPGLALYGVVATFASVDWLMSLEPRWYSTIYPVLYAAGQLLNGFAFSVAVVLLLHRRPPFAGILSPAQLRDLGNLMLAFVMFWAYISVSQLLLIWTGNLPEEIPWYLRRSRGGWQAVCWLLAVLNFAVPFLLLLMRDVKENPRALAAVAGGLLLMRFVDVLWWIEPAYDHEGQYFFWLLDVAATLFLGGLTVAWFCRQLQRRPLLPAGIPNLREALGHE
jgi:hypothetical protein